MLRGIYNLKHRPNSGAFLGIMEGHAIGILCDFVPVMFLLIFNFKNFNKREEEEGVAEQEVQ